MQTRDTNASGVQSRKLISGTIIILPQMATRRQRIFREIGKFGTDEGFIKTVISSDVFIAFPYGQHIGVCGGGGPWNRRLRQQGLQQLSGRPEWHNCR